MPLMEVERSMAYRCNYCGFETDKDNELLPYDEKSIPTTFKEKKEINSPAKLICLPCLLCY